MNDAKEDREYFSILSIVRGQNNSHRNRDQMEKNAKEQKNKNKTKTLFEIQNTY